MRITNNLLGRIVVKALGLKPMSVRFEYRKDIYDEELTKLGFLNQVKGEFNEQAALFNEAIDEEIEAAVK